MVNPEILKYTLDFLIKEFKDVSGVKYGQPKSSDRIHYLLFNEARAWVMFEYLVFIKNPDLGILLVPNKKVNTKGIIRARIKQHFSNNFDFSTREEYRFAIKIDGKVYIYRISNLGVKYMDRNVSGLKHINGRLIPNIIKFKNNPKPIIKKYGLVN